MPQSSPCAPAFGDIATASMPVIVSKACGQRFDNLERPLRGRDRLQRMDVGESRQARDFFVEARIVLHRARAERVDAGVDRIVVARQAYVMADRLRLGEAGQFDRASARVRAQPRVERVRARRDRRRSHRDAPFRRSAPPPCRSPRFPVKVPRGRTAAVSGRVGRPCTFMERLLPEASPKTICKRLRIGRAVVFGIGLRARDDDAIVEPRRGQEP